MRKKEQPIIVGLDIGTTKIVAIAGRKNEFGKIEILGFGLADSAGVNHGIVLNIEKCIGAIEQALSNCKKSNPNLDIKEVYVGIAGKHIRSLTGRGDKVRANADLEISKDDIDSLIADQQKTFIPAGDKIIDIIPQDFTVDNTSGIINPIGMSGIKIGANFHLITADRNAIKNIIRCVERSELITRDLVLQPLASSNAVMVEEDLEAGVAIVDIGGGTTDMAVFYDGILRHTSVIPFGGVNITDDIKMGLGVLKAQAEQMKINYGSAIAGEANPNAYITIPGLRGLPAKEISVTNLSHIIEARMVEIMEEVLLQLKVLGLDKRLFGGIILTGGGAQLKNIKQLTEFVTGINTRIGYPNEHLASGPYTEALMNPAYATCIGLIIRGYNDYENNSFRFMGEHGNVERHNWPSGDSGPEVTEPLTVTQVAEPEVQEPLPEPDSADPKEKHPKKMPKIISLLKDSFWDLFGEIEEQDFNDIKNS